MARIYNHFVTDNRIKDRDSAALLITRIAACPEYDGHYISLRDLKHSSDEGNKSVQLAPDTPCSQIISELETRGTDRLFVLGTYQGIMTGIGVDLSTYRITISVPKSARNAAKEISGFITDLI